jgi:replicative DNA helicase
MMELDERGENIDRVTVANELQRWNELESLGGLGYPISLDDGLPHLPNLDACLRIIR